VKTIAKNLVSFWHGLKHPDQRVMMLLWAAADIVRFVIGAPMRRVSQITPQLHLGPQYQRRGWPILAARGVTAVVNLRTEFDDNHAGVAPARYLYLPTINNEAPTLEQLGKGVDFIAAEIGQGGGVYVHCRSGVGRAATMAAAYLVSTGLTPDEAWARIRSVRPYVCPNPTQIAQVERFARIKEEKVYESGDLLEFALR
jgi:predicted protein tyrosine phosphatase